MKVKDLIEALSAMPTDAEVLIHTYYMDDDDEAKSLGHAKVGSAFLSNAKRSELELQEFDITIGRGSQAVAVITDLSLEDAGKFATRRDGKLTTYPQS